MTDDKPATLPRIGNSYPVPSGTKAGRSSGKAQRRMLRAAMKAYPLRVRAGLRELARRSR